MILISRFHIGRIDEANYAYFRFYRPLINIYLRLRLLIYQSRRLRYLLANDFTALPIHITALAILLCKCDESHHDDDA